MVDSSRGQLPIRFTGHRSRQPRTLLAVQLRQSPTPDVAGRVQVRVVFVRTAHAIEVRLRRSRAGIDVSARGAGLAGYASMARRLLQPVSRMARLSPALACTFVPGFSLVPLGARHRPGMEFLDRNGAAGQAARDVVLPVAPAHGHRRCVRASRWRVRSRRREPRRCWRLIFAARRHISGACRMRAWRPSLTAIWPTFMSAGHGPVVRALDGGDGVTDDRHPFAVDAFQDGLDGLSVRARVAAAPAQPEPAQLREVQLVVPDADVLRDRPLSRPRRLNRGRPALPRKNRRHASAWCFSVYRTGAHGMACSQGVARRSCVNALPSVNNVGAAGAPHMRASTSCACWSSICSRRTGRRLAVAGCRTAPGDDLAMFHIVGRTRRRCPGGSVEPDARRRLLHACSCNTEQ